MSDILDLLINHFEELEPFDYVLIALLVLLIAAAVAGWLRVIYRESSSAQKAAIQGWESAAAAFQAERDVATGKAQRLEHEITETQAAMKQRQSQLFVGMVASSLCGEQRGIVSYAKSMLALYTGLRIEDHDEDAPRSAEVFKSIHAREQEIAASYEPLNQAIDDALRNPEAFTLPEGIPKTVSAQTEAARAVGEEMRELASWIRRALPPAD